MASSLPQTIQLERFSLQADLTNNTDLRGVNNSDLQQQKSLATASTAAMLIPLYRENAEDPTVQMMRYVAEMYMTLPLVVFGVVGNVVSFFVLCHHRRQRLQTTTTLLQVC